MTSRRLDTGAWLAAGALYVGPGAGICLAPPAGVDLRAAQRHRRSRLERLDPLVEFEGRPPDGGLVGRANLLPRARCSCAVRDPAESCSGVDAAAVGRPRRGHDVQRPLPALLSSGGALGACTGAAAHRPARRGAHRGSGLRVRAVPGRANAPPAGLVVLLDAARALRPARVSRRTTPEVPRAVRDLLADERSLDRILSVLLLDAGRVVAAVVCTVLAGLARRRLGGGRGDPAHRPPAAWISALPERLRVVARDEGDRVLQRRPQRDLGHDCRRVAALLDDSAQTRG